MRRSNVRWNAALGEFELRCDDCKARGNVASYWPITTEFWDKRTMVRCRSCNLERHRLAKRRLPKEQRAADMRAWRAKNPGYNAAATALYRRQNPDAKRASDMRYDTAHREERRLANRAYRERRKAA